MNERDVLMKRIQVCDFAMVDASLYLDSHPDDQKAIAFYKKHQAMKREAVAAYERKYGPVMKENFDGETRWSWVDGPWPWQREED